MTARPPPRVATSALLSLLLIACTDATASAPTSSLATTIIITTTTTTITITTTNRPAPPASTSTVTTSAPTTAPAPLDPYAQPGWLARENQLPGTDEWHIADDPAHAARYTPTDWIEGFADATSTQYGQTLTLFVNTPADTFTVTAFRMGWYGGTQARKIWQSTATAGVLQFPAGYDPVTGMAEALWAPTLTFEVTSDWPPGAYLLKLDSSGGGAHYVPLTVRHDAAVGDLLFMNAVTTWQAYNPWGGCTLYECFAPRRQSRATTVSFDRPYAHSYGQGAADFPTHELPLISFIEEQGFDTAYITNIDLHREPTLAAARRALISPGHDEYYSSSMRGALVDALAAGSNIAIFGANAVYRSIRLEPGADGAGERREVNFRKTDPQSIDKPELATVNWSQTPLRKPEAEIVGIQYGCARVRASMRLTNTGNWIYSGTGAREGQLLRNLVGVEFDELAPPSLTPAGLEVVAATRLDCRGLTYQQVAAYHTTTSNAGVFAAGTIDWNCGLDGSCARIPRSEIVRGITLNVLRAFAAGPAGLEHPSRGNASNYRTPMHQPVLPPPTTPSTTIPPWTFPTAPPATAPSATAPLVTAPPATDPPTTATTP